MAASEVDVGGREIARTIRRETGKDKTTIWRWQHRYAEAGIKGLKRDKTRKRGTPPFGPEIKANVLAKTMTETPANATHKTPEVKAWLAKHPRFHLHFTPKGASDEPC